MTPIYFNPDADGPEEFDQPISSDGPPSPNEFRAYGLALLALATLIAIGEVAFRWGSAASPAPDNPQDCAVITDSTARLACYDTVFHRVAPEPAKGANPPMPTKF
jgi:hypothetical protein